jgi:hypothetical protein
MMLDKCRPLSPLRLGLLALMLLFPRLAAARTQEVVIAVSADDASTPLPPRFLGLSYEMSMLLPNAGRHYFDASNHALVNTFKTLGIASLRVGANAVDDPRIPSPQEKDIDAFFDFARAAGTKVIYSFRLKQGNPSESARLAAYVATHHADALDSFSIGNEPNFYFPAFESFFAQWKLHYDAILKAVPNAVFCGPSVANHPPAAQNTYPVSLAKALFADGHLAEASDHYYFLGRRGDAEKDPAGYRARFLSDGLHATYEKAYAAVGAELAAQGIPYRIDELNSLARGGGRNSSDTYAAALWALDCTHWWAAHHIRGMNYHTGNGANYAAFVGQPDGLGFSMRPQAYAYLAFTQGAHGRLLRLKTQCPSAFDFDAYAYGAGDGSIYLTLINKSFGTKACPASVTLQLPPNTGTGAWRQMDLTQENQDVAAKTGVTLGGATISLQGAWPGQWKEIRAANSETPVIQVAPASATILRVFP